MPSITHEGPLDLLRQHPEIAVGLIQGTPGISLPHQATAALAPTDMSAVVPVQYLADMVVLISDAATGEPVLAVIIEPQLRDSETKRYSWPVYVTTARRLASDAARQFLEAMMKTSEYEKTFVEKIHDQGKAEGLAEGKAEGKAEGVLKLLDLRHLAPSMEQRQRIASCTDAAQLDRWFDRAATADTADEIFAD